MPSWKSLEDFVRSISTLRWGSQARSEIINGVQIDCVLKRNSDYYVLAEVTENDTLSKVRDDIIKLQTARNYLFTQNIYSKCYCIIDGNVTTSMIQSGNGVNIDVLTINQFENEYFNFSKYHTIRKEKIFGSCVDALTGKNEFTKYINVKYNVRYHGQTKQLGTTIDIDRIIDLLWANNKIVILGEFGCGKSRCIKQLFDIISESAPNTKRYPIAINLRDNWGLKTHGEVIRRHFEDLGLKDEADSVLRALHLDGFCFLLDGFDEISTQLWSDEPGKLEVTRHESLSSVRDLANNIGGGLIIAGREHYFNSDKEMLHTLGLDDTAIILELNNEFTESEYEEYIGSHDSDFGFPLWLPKRPLICSILLSLEQEFIDELFGDYESDIRFWTVFIDVVCKRESRIKGVLEPETIRQVLIKLARLTRKKSANVGPVTLSEIKQCFEDILGQYPIDQASVMLQRLPGLGRYEAETENRRFVDIFILDGLRALDLVEILKTNDYKVNDELWLNPLFELGLKITGQFISENTQLKNNAVRYIDKFSGRNNKIIPCDILASLLMSGTFNFDFNNISILDGNFTVLNFADQQISNLNISSSTIDVIILKNFNCNKFTLSDSFIGIVEGVTDQHGLPSWIRGCDVQKYTSLKTTAAIKRADLTTSQKIFVAIIKKTFFQRGKGRKQEALLRGLGLIDRKGLTDRIIKLLIRDGILNETEGDEGPVYIPVRKHTDRMKKILSELTLSDDQLWSKITSI